MRMNAEQVIDLQDGQEELEAAIYKAIEYMDAENAEEMLSDIISAAQGISATVYDALQKAKGSP